MEWLRPETGEDDGIAVCSARERPGSRRVGSFHYSVVHKRWTWSADVAVMHGVRVQDLEPTVEALMQRAHLQDRARIDAAFDRIAAGDASSARYRVVDSDGAMRWLVMFADRTVDMAGVTGGTIGTSGLIIDVTDEVQGGITAGVSEMAASRAVIEQAKGVLMAAYGMDADHAFDKLVQRSQESNTKLRDVARHFVDSMSAGLGPHVRHEIDNAFDAADASQK